MGTFGPSLNPVAPSPGAYFGGDPPPTLYTSGDFMDEEPLVTWARNANGVLKQERQEVTSRMREAINLSKGGTGNIWKNRPQWKIGTRLNKCIAAGTRVSTEYGLLPIEEVEPFTNTSNGLVENRIYNGDHPVVRITTRRGFTLRCTPDHKISSGDEWISAKNLQGRRINLQPPQFFLSTQSVGGREIDERWGRFLGYFSGDGSCDVSDGLISVACDSKDQDVISDVTLLMNDLLFSLPTRPGRKSAINPTVHERNNCTIILVHRAVGVEFLQKLGVADNKKRIVCVPNVIFRSRQGIVIEYLRGLFESDGCANKRQRQVFLHSSNEQFIRDVALLLFGLGIQSSVQKLKNNGGPNNRTGVRVLWALVLGSQATELFRHTVGFVSKRKQSILEKKRGHGRIPFELDFTDEVVSIEPDGVCPVYDLTISSTHQFSANGIIVHNCFTVPNKWSSILTDNEQTINFNSNRIEGQRTAAILTAAFLKAYTDNGWQRVIRNAVFDSRVQGIAYLSLRPDIFHRNKNQGRLFAIPGIQVYVDRNATSIDDAELIMYEYRESYGKVIARFPDVKDELQRKYQNIYDPQDLEGSPQASPPTTLAMPSGSSWDGAATSSAYTVNNPPYTGTPNPPDEAGGTSGILIREFWARNHKTVKVRVPLFTASGEPATIPLEIEYDDGTTELMRRVVTEGNVVYELPQSIVDGLHALEDYGGIRILDEMDAYEVCYHKVDSMLYPDGRLLVIVDESILPEDGNKLNPLGYFPFIPVVAHPLSSAEYYPLSDIDLIKDPYEALIRLVSLMFDNAMLAGNSIWRIPESSNLQNDDITNAPGAVQREDPMTLKFGKREPAPDMPQFVMKLIEFYLQQIDDLSGLTAAALGKQNAKAQQSTDSTLMNQEQASIDFRDAQRSLKYALTVLGQQYQEFVERFYTEPELVEIKNDLGQKEAVPLLGSHLVETFRVEAKPGSLMSSTPTARLTTAMNLIGSGLPLMDLPEIWKLLEEVGAITSARELEERISKERVSPTDKWKVPGAEPKPKKGGNSKKPNSKRSRAGQTQGSG